MATVLEKIGGKEFYAYHTDKALDLLQKDGCRALFMPELIDLRIEAPKKDEIWTKWYCAPSIRATGTIKGEHVVVYAHVQNYFSNPQNITKAIENLTKGAGRIPQGELERLAALEDGEKVFVVDYEKLKKSTSGVIKIDRALKHPQTVPFLGGEKRAKKYLGKFKEVYGNKIGIWHSDDLSEQPLARLLFVGSGYDLGGLCGDVGLLNGRRFVGVREKQKTPTLEQILNASETFVPAMAKAEFEKSIKELFA